MYDESRLSQQHTADISDFLQVQRAVGAGMAQSGERPRNSSSIPSRGDLSLL